MNEISRIGIISLAQFHGFIGFLYLLIWGIPILVIALVLGELEGLAVGFLLYGIALVGGTIFFAISGAVTALFYNFIATIVGGIEVKIE